MEPQLTLITAGSMLLRLVIIAALVWICYHGLRRRSVRVRIDGQSRYARERWRSTGYQR